MNLPALSGIIAYAHAAVPPRQRRASGLCARAVELGFTEIGFTDHSPMARDDF